MSVTVVTGRCGSGKSRFLTRHIAGLIEDPFAKVIVLTPGQLTFETEKSIILGCGKAGIFGLQVFSIQRLAYRILEETGAPAFISNAEKAVVCSKALLEAGDVYRGAAQTKGFEQCLADLFTELKHYSQTPQSLRETAAQTRDDALRGTLHDTAAVFEQYLTLCGARPDTADMFALAAQQAKDAAFLQGAHVVIDGLDSYCPAVMLMIGEVIRLGTDTMAAFRGEADGSDSNLFASERRDMQQFISAAQRSGAAVDVIAADMPEPRYSNDEMAFVEANLYRYPTAQYEKKPTHIHINESDSVAHEVQTLAAGILAEVGAGRRFSDITVAVGGIDTYAAEIKAYFSQCGIPYFIDERRTLAKSAFFDFVYKAICAAAGDATAVPGYVYSRFSPIDAAAQLTLGAYAARYSYMGWHYLEPFWRGEHAQQAEAIRKTAMTPLAALKDGMQAGSATRQTDAVLRFLSDCGAEDKLSALCEMLGESGMAEQAEYFSQVYEKTAEVLGGIADVFGSMPLKPQEMCDLFETGCEALRIAVIPPTTDEVGLFDISLARLKSARVLFAIGVQDGVWPAGGDAPGIFSQGERDMMAGLGLDIGVYDLSAEKLKVYTALAKPSDKLYLSYNLQSGQPSVLIDRMGRMFPHLVIDKNAAGATSLQGMQARLLGEIALALRGEEMDDTMLSVCARFLQKDGWKQAAADMLLRTNAALHIDENTALALYGSLRGSATRIENYYRCPFRHFMSYGIKARPRREYVGDRMDTGLFLHLALELFAKGLLDDRVDIKEITEQACSKRMREAAALAAKQHENGKLLEDERFAVQYLLLVSELQNTAIRIRRHFEGSNARISRSEMAFADFTVETAFGDVAILGKIDRIDTAGDYFRVVDYKSSAARFSLEDLGGGVALQLPVYIEAARRILGRDGKAANPAGGYYMKIGDAFKGSADDIRKAARMTGISLGEADVLGEFSAVAPDGGFTAIDQRVTRSGALHGAGKSKFFSQVELNELLGRAQTLIRDAAEAIYRGDTAIRPATGTSRGDACAFCDYGAVCMMNAEYDGNAFREIVPLRKEELTKEADDVR